MRSAKKKLYNQTSQLKIGNFVIGETLGVGSFGKVKAGYHIVTNHRVAIKILNREKIKGMNVVDKIRREIEFLRLFNHPHIIKLYQVISTPTDFFMIMEFVNGGELFDYIVKKGRLTECEARRFFQQIISGVDYCHRYNVVHRDLKPENLLLDSYNNVKIADFGLSNMMNDGEFLRTSCGSPNYAAPEVISGRLYIGPEVDIWSCGVIFYALLCGFLPFEDPHIPSLFKKIKSGNFYIPPYLSSEVVDILKGMIEVEPKKRWNVEKLRRNAWFKCNLDNSLFPTHFDITDSLSHSIIKELSEKFNEPESEVRKSLENPDPMDHLVIAYKLIRDNHLNSKLSTIASKVREKKHGKSKMSDIDAYCPKTSPHNQSHDEQSSCDKKDNDTNDDDHNLIFPTRNYRISQLNTNKWHLGIRSFTKPATILKEIYRILLALNLSWKVITNFHLIVKCERAYRTIYIVLKFYNVNDEYYLLDFTHAWNNDHTDPTKRPSYDSSFKSALSSSFSSPSSFAPQQPSIMSSFNYPDSQNNHKLTSENMLFLDICSDIIVMLTSSPH